MRQEMTKKKRLDKAIPAATNGDNQSRICPPAGRRGWLEDILHDVFTQNDNRGPQICAECYP